MNQHLRAGRSLLLLTALLAIAGCGASSGTGSTKAGTTQLASTATTAASTQKTAKPAPHNAFISRAEAICQRTNKQILALKSKNSGREEILRVVPVHAQSERVALRALRRLKSPAAIAPEWQQILAYRSALAEDLTKLVSAARANDLATLTKLVSSKAALHKKLLTVARKAGFKSCSLVG
jgi:hypothetical protein